MMSPFAHLLPDSDHLQSFVQNRVSRRSGPTLLARMELALHKIMIGLRRFANSASLGTTFYGQKFILGVSC